LSFTILRFGNIVVFDHFFKVGQNYILTLNLVWDYESVIWSKLHCNS